MLVYSKIVSYTHSKEGELNMEPQKLNTIPKYTQYELSTMVQQKVDGNPSFSDPSDEERKILNQIIEGKVSFKIKHYKMISCILSISVEDLLSDEELNSKKYFRSTTGESEEVQKFISKIDKLFSEWIIQNKLKGNL